MRNLIVPAALLALAISSPSHAADASVLKCSTDGTGLALVEVNLKSDGTGVVAVTVSEADDAPVGQFIIRSGLKDLRTTKSATIIAQKDGEMRVGGTYEKAVLLRVLDGKKAARLAMDGNVYSLQCF